jgi:hypothetical protein
MARPKLYHPDQPWSLRWILWLYEFCASLKLAVILIASVAAVLAFATFVEANTGTAGVQWYIYQNPGFLWLLGLLALNIFCAAAIRYPWKRHQTGFVITHIGLLTLLAGAAISYRESVNSQLLVELNNSSNVAVDHDAGYLVIDGLPGDKPEETGKVQFPVKFGPFNWADLEPSIPWRRLQTLLGRDSYPAPWVHRPVPVYSGGGVTVDIVDYYSRSERREVPFVNLNFRQTVLGFELPVALEYEHRTGFGAADFQGMGQIFLGRTASEKEFAAYPECIPQRTVEGDGVVVIQEGEETHQLTVAKLQAASDAGKPIELSPQLTVELLKFELVSPSAETHLPVVRLRIHQRQGGDEHVYNVIRCASLPFIRNEGKAPENLAIEYYHPIVPGQIAILEGPGNKLAYRVWQQKLARVVSAGPLVVDEPVQTWSMGGGSAVWQMTATQYVPQDNDGAESKVLPLPFLKDDPLRGTTRRIKVRVAWKDGDQPQSREFWLRQNEPDPWEKQAQRQVEILKLPDGKLLTVNFRVKETPVGFTMRLDEFDLQVDPGAPMASNYTSKVTVKDVIGRDGKVDQSRSNSKFIITMNQPLDYPDPEGRTLRFFQENYIAPRNGMKLASIFRVNYNPGRPIVYLGCLLVVSGIFVMFYMRAYFFKPIKRFGKAAPAAAAPARVKSPAAV